MHRLGVQGRMDRAYAHSHPHSKGLQTVGAALYPQLTISVAQVVYTGPLKRYSVLMDVSLAKWIFTCPFFFYQFSVQGFISLL